jgi:hypothetical protein
LLPPSRLFNRADPDTMVCKVVKSSKAALRTLRGISLQTFSNVFNISVPIDHNRLGQKADSDGVIEKSCGSSLGLWTDVALLSILAVVTGINGFEYSTESGRLIIRNERRSLQKKLLSSWVTLSMSTKRIKS